ncbi:SMP-30/gluconolactonase/LRE family protein [Micromonospora sp. NPDC047730]|uniref:SMP-30/gluconolactonase/LRE family protein n=1 Tax=Micromonospora sp. NPDC047730 TaxID=3364253 RepID=UPI0037117E4C
MTTTATTHSAAPAKKSPARRRLLRVTAWSAGLFVLAGMVFLAIPSPIDPLAWSTPPAPAMTGVLAPNQELARAELVTPTPDGPEDITFDAQGRLYTGDESGIIYRLTAGGQAERFADTGGRPNGLRFAPDGHLLVADTRRGLLSVDPTGNVSVLTNSAGGKRIALANELAVATDGTVYFSDSSDTVYDKINLTHELLEQRPSGRLLRYDPHSHRTDVLLSGLSLANGVALAPDESFVLVNDSFRYHITRYWLTGPKAGTHDTFADNLPGFPDNLTPVGDGTYWVALYQPRDPNLDRLQSHAFLKAQIAKLPSSLLTGATRRASTALQLDSAGRPIRAFSDTTGHIFGLTTVVPHDGYLYLGTDHNGSNDVMRYHLPDVH